MNWESARRVEVDAASMLGGSGNAVFERLESARTDRWRENEDQRALGVTCVARLVAAAAQLVERSQPLVAGRATKRRAESRKLVVVNCG